MSQNGSLEQDKEQFTRLSWRASGFSQELLLSYFIGGLKNDIRVDVKAQKLRVLYEACDLAKIYEKRHEGHKISARGVLPNRNVNAPTT